MADLRARADEAWQRAERLRRMVLATGVTHAETERNVAVARLAKRLLGLDVIPEGGEARVDDVTFFAERDRLYAQAPCGRCGLPTQSATPIESWADLGGFLTGEEGWTTFHGCGAVGN